MVLFMKKLLKVAGVLTLVLSGGRSWANRAEAPLPSVNAIIERVMTRSQQESENDVIFKANYFFKRSRTTEYRNLRGRLLERQEKISANEPTPHHPDVGDASAGGRANEISPDAAQHKRDFVANTNLVRRFAFAVMGRELVEGRSTLMVEFKPASQKLPATDFKERCLNQMAGRIWVDEVEDVIVKVEARLTEKIGLVGGLLGSVQKFNFSFGRERTEDGLWYTRQLTWRVEMRELVVNRVIDYVETRTDVHKSP